jgi:RNA polymerase sigma-70 factor (ECF subfamily)
MSNIGGDEAPLVELARRAHPALAVDERAFALRVRAALETIAAEDLAANVADLYLCFACLRGDARALAALDERLVRAAGSALATMALTGAEREDVLQRARQRLLAPERGAPKLGSYAGRGPLGPWLRACVVRVALSLPRAHKAEVSDEEKWLAWPSPGDDPELALLRRTCGDAFRRAVVEALEALPYRDRLLLRQHYVDGVSAEQLAALQGVHLTTVYRRLERARDELLLGTRQRLGRAVPLQRRELDSLLNLLGSELAVSIRRLMST